MPVGVRWFLSLAWACVLLIIAGCGPELQPPMTLVRTEDQPALWAVAPFANESGSSNVDVFRISDVFVREAEQIYGVHVLPVNRTLAAMEALELRSIRSAGEAEAVLGALGADGLIVGTVTAYDPYAPKTFGAAVQLFVRPGTERAMRDPRRLVTATRGEPSPGELGPENPIAQAAGIFDAANHSVLTELANYASGRHVPDSAYGPGIFLASMELYIQFVSHQLLADLLGSDQYLPQPEAQQIARR